MHRSGPLLCELHAHTTWSDGEVSLTELVDLYGSAGFDVLAVTDHVVRADDPFHPEGAERPPRIRAENYDGYLAAIEREAERARALYDLVVIPGLELTYNDPDPLRGAHAVAVGLREFIGVDDGLDTALREAREQGVALLAAHPYTHEASRTASRTTARFAEQPGWAAAVVDRFELCNRHDFFAWVAEARLPVVATGHFHRPEHLDTWKTLVPCAKDEAALVDYLRSPRPVSLTRLEPASAVTELAA